MTYQYIANDEPLFKAREVTTNNDVHGHLVTVSKDISTFQHKKCRHATWQK